MPSKDYHRYSSSEQKKRRIIRLILEVLVSVLLIVPAVVLSIHLKKLVLNRAHKTIELKPNSEGYDKWLDPPVTTVRSYHLYNISNPLDVAVDPSTTILKLNETRPYTYNVTVKKNDIKWSEDNKEISYSVERFFSRHPTEFDSSFVNESGIFVDMLRATFRTQFEVKPADAFYDLGGHDPFYFRNSVEQLEGFTSPLFESMKDKMYGPNTNKSGFIYRYNGSRLYNVTIKAGLMDKGQVLHFASETVALDITSDNYSFPIYDGLTFAPNLFDKPSLNIYQSDFCNPIRIEYVDKVDMYGMELHQYAIKFIDFNQCTNASNASTCPEVHMLDVSKCISNQLEENTILFSKAHFYGADNETTEDLKIEGFNASKEKHDSFLFFEPYTGTPIKAVYRMQLNINANIDPVKLTEHENGTLISKTKRKSVQRILPVVWLDQQVNLDQQVINKLYWFQFTHRHGQWILIVAAITLSIVFIGLMEFFGRRADRNNRYDRGCYTKTEGSVQY